MFWVIYTLISFVVIFVCPILGFTILFAGMAVDWVLRQNAMHPGPKKEKK